VEGFPVFTGVTGLVENTSTRSASPMRCRNRLVNVLNNIDWKQVATCKVFAFIKATERTTVEDKQFASNWSAARDAGLLRGAYHFLHPSVDAVKQAEFFLSKVVTSELPPVLDVEATDNVPSTKLVQCVKTWVEHVAAHLRRPLIYASPSFWAKLPAANIEQDADLWIAEWECEHPRNIGAWPGWSFWQYTLGAITPFRSLC
jgi:lysozyme